MYGLMGIQDPRMRFGGPVQQAQPSRALMNVPRETIGPSLQMQRTAEAQTAQPQGLMGMSPSQGLFQLYMSQLFKQKYAPPMIQGGPLQNYGGYFGFGSPAMPRQQTPVQAPVTNPDPYTGLPVWGGPGREPSGPYVTRPSPV